jgi:hypothetical protein
MPLHPNVGSRDLPAVLGAIARMGLLGSSVLTAADPPKVHMFSKEILLRW